VIDTDCIGSYKSNYHTITKIISASVGPFGGSPTFQTLVRHLNRVHVVYDITMCQACITGDTISYTLLFIIESVLQEITGDTISYTLLFIIESVGL
jgi:hypothetical protein